MLEMTDDDVSSQQSTLLEDMDDKKTSPSEAIRSKLEIVRLQFEYAWRYFQHYAQQRVSIFNFFMFFAGASGTVYGTLLNSHHWIMATILSILAAILSLFFYASIDEWKNWYIWLRTYSDN